MPPLPSPPSGELALALPSYSSVQPARVAQATLRQHDLRVLEDGRTLVLAMALSPPRLWSFLLEAALDAFVDGFYRPHDGRMSTRMHQGLRVAQQRVRTRVEALIERRMPDVGLLALSLESSILHVLSAGPLRAYLHRRKGTRRLSAREESALGLLKATPSWCAEHVEAGDLFFVGSLSACQEDNLQQLRATLDTGRSVAPQQVVELLTSPAAERGVAAISVAFRIPTYLTTGG